jgi:hypothetical protein
MRGRGCLKKWQRFSIEVVLAFSGKTFEDDELRRVSVFLTKESSEVRVVDLDGLYASLRWCL